LYRTWKTGFAFVPCIEFVSQGFAEDSGGGGNIFLVLWYPLKAINLTGHGYIASLRDENRFLVQEKSEGIRSCAWRAHGFV